MSGDHDVCSNCGAEAMWCDCDPDRKVERAAYIRGAKDALEQFHLRIRFRENRWGHQAAFGFQSVYTMLGTFKRQIERGLWPKGE